MNLPTKVRHPNNQPPTNDSLICKESVAAGDVVAEPPTVEVTSEVVTACWPLAAPAGTCSVTCIVHEAPSLSEPPENVTSDVPLRLLPAPHASFIGSPVATRPVNAASRSIVKAMLVADEPARTEIENWKAMGSFETMDTAKKGTSSTTVPLGTAGSSTNEIVNCGIATRKKKTKEKSYFFQTTLVWFLQTVSVADGGVGNNDVPSTVADSCSTVCSSTVVRASVAMVMVRVNEQLHKTRVSNDTEASAICTPARRRHIQTTKTDIVINTCDEKRL